MRAQPKQFDTNSVNNGKSALSSQCMKRILLVDSQAHILRVMKLSLDRNGYEVDTALNGEVALEKMRETHYDVLITDNELSSMTGAQLLGSVSAHFNTDIYTDAPKMFLLTPENMPVLPENELPQAKFESLEKPVSLRYLVARLNEMFGAYETDTAVLVGVNLKA